MLACLFLLLHIVNHTKTGSDAECRALLTENVNGSVPVPEFVAGIVAERFKESANEVEALGVGI